MVITVNKRQGCSLMTDSQRFKVLSKYRKFDTTNGFPLNCIKQTVDGVVTPNIKVVFEAWTN